MMRLRYKSVERANFKLIEFELYNYDQTKKQYLDYQESILHDSGLAPEIRGTHISKPTEAKAIKLVSNVHIQEMQKRINAIQNTYEKLSDIKKQLIIEKYFKKRYTDIGIMDKLNIERATFYRYRREIIEMIADRLGWII